MYYILKICISIIYIFNISFTQSLSLESLRHKPITEKLTLAEWPSYNIQNPHGPGTYAYGYEIDDPVSKNVQFRDEEKLANGTVQGSYGIVRTDGMVTLTRYTSDSGGYHAKTQTFNQRDIMATILTTESPKTSQMPTGIGYLDLRPETVSKDVSQQLPEDPGQQILAEQDKINFTNSPDTLPVPAPILLDRIDNDDDEDDDDDQDNGDHENPDPITNEFTNGNLETLQAILSAQNPITITTTKDHKNHTVGIQFINNYIPHNLQLIPFFVPKRIKPTKPSDKPIEMTFHDPVDDDDNKPFVNDKFHDPLNDFRKISVNKNNQRTIGKRKILTEQNNKNIILPIRRRQDTKLKKLHNKQKDIFKNNQYRIILV